MSDMIVTAWRNTSAKSTRRTLFGLRLGKPLRDRLLPTGVEQVTLHLEGEREAIKVTLEDAFWNQCPEFKHAEIGPWLQRQGVPMPWPRGEPPKFRLIQLAPAEFAVKPFD